MKLESIRLKESVVSDRIRAYEWLYYSDFSPCPSTLLRSGSMGKPTLDEFSSDFTDHFFTGSVPDKTRAYIIVLENTGEEIGFISYDSRHLNDKTAEIDLWMKSSSYTGQGYGPAAIKLLSNELFKRGFTNVILRSSSDQDNLAKAVSKAGFKQAKSDEIKKILTQTHSASKSSDRSHYMVLSKG